MTASAQHALRFAATRFCIASVLVYATVAFGEGWLYATLGFTGAYVLWTVMFILLGSFALAPLVPDQSFAKFTGVFTLAFLGYAIGWIVAYFVLRGSVGEWVGSFAGCLFMTAIFARAFGKLDATPQLFVYLFAANSVGYFLGSILNGMYERPLGMLLWGVAHGVFLGAGLGVVLDGLRGDAEDVKTEDVEM